MSTFFKELTSFSDFALFSKDDHYQPVPDDWWVIITDVKGSTQAVTQGAIATSIRWVPPRSSRLPKRR